MPRKRKIASLNGVEDLSPIITRLEKFKKGGRAGLADFVSHADTDMDQLLKELKNWRETRKFFRAIFGVEQIERNLLLMESRVEQLALKTQQSIKEVTKNMAGASTVASLHKRIDDRIERLANNLGEQITVVHRTPYEKAELSEMQRRLAEIEQGQKDVIHEVKLFMVAYRSVAGKPKCPDAKDHSVSGLRAE